MSVFLILWLSLSYPKPEMICRLFRQSDGVTEVTPPIAEISAFFSYYGFTGARRNAGRFYSIYFFSSWYSCSVFTFQRRERSESFVSRHSAASKAVTML